MAKYALSLPQNLVAEVDAARGDIPRSRVVRRALEAWLTRRELASKNLPHPEPAPDEPIVREEPDA